MNSRISELVQNVRSPGAEASEACLTLGLLLERECIRQPVAEHNTVIADILGDCWNQVRLAPEEVQEVVDCLLAYVSSVPTPYPAAVWALAKCYKPRIVPVLVNLLRSKACGGELAHNALQAVINTGVSSEYRDLALSVISEIADRDIGEVSDEARTYLKHYRKIRQDPKSE